MLVTGVQQSEKVKDREAWHAAVHGVAKSHKESDTIGQLNNNTSLGPKTAYIFAFLARILKCNSRNWVEVPLFTHLLRESQIFLGPKQEGCCSGEGR